MRDVTQILRAVEEGDAAAAADLLPLVYDELRTLAAQRMAREAPGQTLQATARVHDAHLRPVGTGEPGGWNSRGHFFGAAAEAMRRILIDRARAKGAQKRGGDRQRLSLDAPQLSLDDPPSELLDLDEALTKLGEESGRKADLVKLRFFAGLTTEEAARVLGVSTRTAEGDWAYSRAWLFYELSRGWAGEKP